MHCQMMLKLLAAKSVRTAQKTTGDAGYGDQIRSNADYIRGDFAHVI